MQLGDRVLIPVGKKMTLEFEKERKIEKQEGMRDIKREKEGRETRIIKE